MTEHRLGPFEFPGNVPDDLPLQANVPAFVGRARRSVTVTSIRELDGGGYVVEYAPPE